MRVGKVGNDDGLVVWETGSGIHGGIFRHNIILLFIALGIICSGNNAPRRC